VTYAEALRLRGEVTGDPPAGGGAQVSVPSWRRTREARYRPVAGRCPDCGTLTFPPEGACTGCSALVDFERVRLAREGRVETVTGVSPGGAPPEFAQQEARGGEFAVAVCGFGPADGGEEAGVDGAGAGTAADGSVTDGTVSLPLQVTDADPGTVAAGDAVEAVLRRVYTQEGVTRYGTKVRPR
jgi:hydroxymethylglutaryl-CoA synthase